MSQKAKRYLRILGGLVCFSSEGWTVWSWASGIERHVGSFQLGHPEYFALCLLFGGGMFLLGWPWIRRLSPKVRFQELGDDIKGLVAKMEDDNEGRGESDAIVMSYDTYLEVHALIRKLDALSIPWPNPARENTRIWWEWLPRLYGFSRVGDLHEIRQDKLIISDSGEPIAFGRRDYALVPVDRDLRTDGLIIPDRQSTSD